MAVHLEAEGRFHVGAGFRHGPVFLGGWLQNGSVWNSHTFADFNSQLGAGLVLDTLIGPVLVGTGVGLDGGWRTFMGVGRIF